jgi:hypothetical protein
MLAPFHLGKRDSGSKNIISINKLTNLFIKVIKNFLLLSPAGLCFPSLPTCSASVITHLPQSSIRFNFLTVITRLDFPTVIIWHSLSLSLSGLTGVSGGMETAAKRLPDQVGQ